MMCISLHYWLCNNTINVFCVTFYLVSEVKTESSTKYLESELPEDVFSYRMKVNSTLVSSWPAEVRNCWGHIQINLENKDNVQT